MLSSVAILQPENLFDLPRSNPLLFLAMGIYYPLFSAFGQEVIYRTFFFRRYGKLLKGEWTPVIVSGIVFSYLHIVYYHPVSMIITLIGGRVSCLRR
jgi:membrane protease YdiL (CAAX protease family)